MDAAAERRSFPCSNSDVTRSVLIGGLSDSLAAATSIRQLEVSGIRQRTKQLHNCSYLQLGKSQATPRNAGHMFVLEIWSLTAQQRVTIIAACNGGGSKVSSAYSDAPENFATRLKPNSWPRTQFE